MNQEPINSNIGITYAPQEPPRVQSQLSDESRKARRLAHEESFEEAVRRIAPNF